MALCNDFLWLGDAVTGVRAFSVCTRSLQEEKSTALQIFDQEYNHQLHSVLRIEKVSVEYENLLGEKTQLQMNKNISTPYSCAKRKCTEFFIIECHKISFAAV